MFKLQYPNIKNHHHSFSLVEPQDLHPEAAYSCEHPQPHKININNFKNQYPKFKIITTIQIPKKPIYL